MYSVMPKDIKKWKAPSLASGTSYFLKDWNSSTYLNPRLLAPLRSSKSLEEWGNYPVLEPMLVIVGRVPTDLELQDFF